MSDKSSNPGQTSTDEIIEIIDPDVGIIKINNEYFRALDYVDKEGRRFIQNIVTGDIKLLTLGEVVGNIYDNKGK